MSLQDLGSNYPEDHPGDGVPGVGIVRSKTLGGALKLAKSCRFYI